MGSFLLALALLMQRGASCAVDLTSRCDLKGKWSRFCEKYVVTDDPRSQEQQQADDDKEREDRRRK